MCGMGMAWMMTFGVAILIAIGAAIAFFAYKYGRMAERTGQQP